MTDDANTPVFERGDVVFGEDPFKSDEAARPWVILSNHDGRPFHGEQYIALTLTTQTWMDGLVEIPDERWLRGGTPEPSCIVPWGVQSLDSSDIDFWQGRLDDEIVEEAIAALVAELEQ